MISESESKHSRSPDRIMENTLVAHSAPREWQLRALDRWVAAGRHGIAAVVTGAGKTVFAELCMADTAKHIPGLRFVIVVPTQALLDQWYVSLQDELNLASSSIATYSGGNLRSSPSLVNPPVAKRIPAEGR
jgi:superfamily II DNA or RNA helicase